jgi:restriction system protein
MNNLNPQNAWLVRAGRDSAREEWALTNNVAGGGFAEVGDLSNCQNNDDIRKLLDATFPDAAEGRITNFRGQLSKLRFHIKIGDLIILPRKLSRQLAIGVVTGGYFYDSSSELTKRHRIKVDWKKKDIPRTIVKQDLLYSLGAFVTICKISRNDALNRLVSILEKGVDPGSVASTQPDKKLVSEIETDLVNEVTEIDFESQSLDEITSFINENFTGHKLTELVSEILKANGFYCKVSPPGPDKGIDILAGQGILGLDSPRIVVQVKSGSTSVESRVVNELLGNMRSLDCDQGLLVAWNGITKEAKTTLQNHQLKIRVWEASDIVDQLLESYSNLDSEIKERLPLKQLWVLQKSDF